MTQDLFDLTDRVVVITGGAGLLGGQHARAIAEKNGVPVLVDIKTQELTQETKDIQREFGIDSTFHCGSICDEQFLVATKEKLIARYGRIDGLINNAALNPKVEAASQNNLTRLEDFPIENWNRELEVGLTGSFLCSKIFGQAMAERKKGVILNISSDLGLIAPDQRIYRQDGLTDDQQPTKPVTYSVIKHGLIGLTRYLATYWADQGVRANALCPGGVQTDQPEEFVSRLSALIPIGRMAKKDEYKGAVQFLCSDASAYMNGACVAIDGGRTCW